MPREIQVALAVLMSTAGCGECVTTEYNGFREVLAERAMERGRIPPILPRSASEIEEQHDLDTGRLSLRFRLPAAEIEAFVAELEANGFVPRETRPEPVPVCGSWSADVPAMDEARVFSGAHVMGPAARPSIWQRGDEVDVLVDPVSGVVVYATSGERGP